MGVLSVQASRWCHLMLLGAVAFAAGCTTREFVLEPAEAPWEQMGADSVRLPAFDGPAASWLLADQLRDAVRRTLLLERVNVRETARVQLCGAVTDYVRQAVPGAPRRVRRPASGNFIGDQDVWEVDYTYRASVTLVLRLLDEHGQPVWTRAFSGSREESQTSVAPWPGSDPLPPPSSILNRPDELRLSELMQQALTDLRDSLNRAISAHYAYRVVP